MTTEIRRFALQRYSIPEPKDRTSPAKIRNKELQWIHYADTEKDPLVLEVRIRTAPSIPAASPAHTPGRGAVYAGYSHHGTVANRDGSEDQCVVYIMSGDVCYKRVSIDQYRHAYETARNNRNQDRDHRYSYAESRQGDEAGKWEDFRMPLVDTIKLTVKPPAVAIKLLQPLEQLTNTRGSMYRSVEDYTYDRFQVRFAFGSDVQDFLSILYAHFPVLDPSLRTHHTQHPEPAESIAVSQSTQVYLPNDPARLTNLQCASFRDIHPPPPKRRKENEENLWYGREESANAQGPMQEGRRDTPRYGHAGVQAFSMGRQDSPLIHHGKRTSGPLLHSRRRSPLPQAHYSRETSPHIPQHRARSIDVDGFVKPLPPAYIDTPTPANRIYHLKEVDPNQRPRGNPASSAAASSKRPAKALGADDPFFGGTPRFSSLRHAFDPAERQNMQESFKLPPLRHEANIRPLDEESQMTLPTGLTQLELPDQANNAENVRDAVVEGKQASPRADVSSRSLRRILAPETVSVSENPGNLEPPLAPEGHVQALKPWPEIYEDPGSVPSRTLDNSAKETSSLQRTVDAVSETPPAGQPNQRGDFIEIAKTVTEDRLKSTDHRACGSENQEVLPGVTEGATRMHDTETAHREIAGMARSSPLPASSVRAKITQSASLYALSPEELDYAINTIITEDGFVPFVEKLSRKWREQLIIQARSGQEGKQIPE